MEMMIIAVSVAVVSITMVVSTIVCLLWYGKFIKNAFKDD